MLTLLSPAKTLDYDTPSSTTLMTEPGFLAQSATLIDALRDCSVDDIRGLMKLSQNLAELNVQRYSDWCVPFPEGQAKQAILAFKGDVYTGLQAEAFGQNDLDFAQQHIRMLSGLYGVLKPLDGMLPYRLEMGTKLKTMHGKDLYAFWGDHITNALNSELADMDKPVVVNLASNEYFKAVQKKRLNARLITPVFKDEKNGVYKIISFYAKKARGLMARYVIEQRIDSPEALQAFDVAGYQFCEEDSQVDTWVFKRSEEDLANAQ